ncbi:MAG: multiheme c-type cytochrome [Planctomycetota bacterium]|nr:multiheme c-type cytochrome [Planctomycetota bacterium]
MHLDTRKLIHLAPVLLLGAALVLYLILGLRSSDDEAGEPKPPVEAYAGSRACQPCHEEIWETWARSHHAMAERRVEPGVVGAAYQHETGRRQVTHGSFTSTIRERKGRFEVLTTGADSQVAPYETIRIIGVEPLWQPVVAAPGGRYQVTSLAYDPRKDEWFDVYGEEDRQPHEWGFWANRGMTWNVMCAACHTTGLRKNYHSASDTYETTFEELGVGCESCHGPSQAHVEAAQRGATPWAPQGPAEERDWSPSAFRRRIAQESDAPPEIAAIYAAGFADRILDNCGSCHARRSELTGEFMPGENFLDHYRPQIPDSTDIYYPDGQVRDEDYEYVSFLSSRMYLEGVRCLHCHDAHSSKLRLEGNQLCLACHAEKIDPAAHSHHSVDGSGGQCMGCHMPITVYMQRHPRRDHGFTIPDPLLTKEHDIPNACNRCHEDQSVDWAIEAVDRWYGERMERPSRERTRIVARARGGDDRSVGRELLELARSDPSPLWRAVAVGLLDPWAYEGGVFADQLVASAASESPLVRATAARVMESLVTLPGHQGERGVGVLKKLLDDPVRLVRLEAAWSLRNVLVTGERRHVLEASVPAYRELHHYLGANADQPLGLLQKAVWEVDRGDLDTAVTLLRRAISWDPGSALFYRHLAVALSQQAHPSARSPELTAQAVQAMTRAHELEPENPLFAFELGLALAEARRFEAAAEKLEVAGRLQPDFSRAWYNLAEMRRFLEQPDRALDAIRRAEESEPENPLFLQTRAQIHQALGDDAAAREYFDRARQAAEK